MDISTIRIATIGHFATILSTIRSKNKSQKTNLKKQISKNKPQQISNNNSPTFGTTQQGTGNAKQLALPHTEIAPALRHQKVQPVRVDGRVFQRRLQPHRTQRLPDGGIVAGVEGVEVVANGGGPEDRVLRDDGQTAAQFFQRNPGKVKIFQSVYTDFKQNNSIGEKIEQIENTEQDELTGTRRRRR